MGLAEVGKGPLGLIVVRGEQGIVCLDDRGDCDAVADSVVASRAIRSRFTTCAEKLDRLRSIDCASPMSA